MKSLFDFLLSLFLLFLLSVPFIIVAILIKTTSRGPIFYWSDRIGENNSHFQMPKFRTMSVDTPTVATHLLVNADLFVTPIGKLLRRTSVDELPQLFSILIGDMSFVGPRPALFNQYDLIELRFKSGVHVLKPGLTGWAQINGRDELEVAVKVEYDKYYFLHRTFLFDLRILLITVFKILGRYGISH